MHYQRKVTVIMLGEETVVCSLDEEHAISVPRDHFGFQPVIGQSVILNGRTSDPAVCFVERIEFYWDRPPTGE